MISFLPRDRPLRILCVEEDNLQRRLLQACLDAAEVEALFAGGASEALRLFRNHPMDMVFIDIDAHAQDELAAFEEMCTVPGRDRIPILAVTENECRWTETAYREAGFAGLFQKPIEPSRLFHAMDSALSAAGQPPLLTSPYVGA